MRRAAFVVVALSALAACSLLTGVGDLTVSDGAGDGVPDATTPLDGGAEAAPIAEAGSDAADAAPSRSALYASAVLADKPLGYWRLDETSGTIAKDETGRHDGVYVKGPTLGQPGAAGSGAMTMPRGKQAHMHVASSAFRFPGKVVYSVEAWVKPGDIKDFQWIASTEIVASNDRTGWSFLCQGTGALLYEVWTPIQDGGGGGQIRGVGLSPTLLTAGAFHHVVVTYNGSTATGYVDGVKGNTQNATASAPNVGELDWGCRSDLQHCLDDWTIDELAIYDSVLPPDRVKAHYDLGK